MIEISQNDFCSFSITSFNLETLEDSNVFHDSPFSLCSSMFFSYFKKTSGYSYNHYFVFPKSYTTFDTPFSLFLTYRSILRVSVCSSSVFSSTSFDSFFTSFTFFSTLSNDLDLSSFRISTFFSYWPNPVSTWDVLYVDFSHTFVKKEGYGRTSFLNFPSFTSYFGKDSSKSEITDSF